MKGNICARCLENVIGEENMVNMKSVIEWNEKCEVCGDTAVFYARKDELEKAKFNQKLEEIEQEIAQLPTIEDPVAFKVLVLQIIKNKKI